MKKMWCTPLHSQYSTRIGLLPYYLFSGSLLTVCYLLPKCSCSHFSVSLTVPTLPWLLGWPVISSPLTICFSPLYLMLLVSNCCFIKIYSLPHLQLEKEWVQGRPDSRLHSGTCTWMWAAFSCPVMSKQKRSVKRIRTQHANWRQNTWTFYQEYNSKTWSAI